MLDEEEALQLKEKQECLLDFLAFEYSHMDSYIISYVNEVIRIYFVSSIFSISGTTVGGSYS